MPEPTALTLPDTPPSADFHNFEKAREKYDTPERSQLIDRQEAHEKPDVKKLVDQIRNTIANVGDYFERLACSHDWRNCLWSGQNDNGRKNQSYLGRPPSPWEGASDTRIRIIDEICNENVSRIKHAVMNGDAQAQAHSATGMAEGNADHASRLLRYVMRTQMQPEIADELEFLAQWQEEFGASINHISWDRQNRMESKTITVEEMVTSAYEASVAASKEKGYQDPERIGALAQESVEETIETVTQEENSHIVENELLTWAPHLSKSQAKAIAKELREDGTSTYPQPRTTIDRPEWTALRPMLDVWFPRETENIKKAAWIARTEFLTLDQLRDNVATDGWNPEFVQQVEQHRGTLFDGDISGTASLLSRGMVSYTRSTTDHEDLFQVIRMYYRATDAKGFPAIHEAIIHPEVEDECGRWGLLEGSQNEMPFTAYRRERRKRPIIESRGVPELAFTQQFEIKTQRDSRTDRTELATSPPLQTPMNRGSGKYDLRPGHQLPRKRSDPPFEFLKPPSMDLGTIEIEDSTMDDLNRYFGRIGKNTADKPTALLKQQDTVNNFLNTTTTGFQITWQLMQQYMPPTTIAKVVGNQSNAIKFSREDIAGAYDFSIAFDVRDLDTEFLSKKMETIANLVIPLDTAGVIDRPTLAKLLLTAIDPSIAEQILKDPASAAADEESEEKLALTMMSAGVEPPMVEGQDHALRLQILQESIQANPEMMQRAGGEDEIFTALIENRMKHHQFQLDQRENAQTGRIGAAEVLK